MPTPTRTDPIASFDVPKPTGGTRRMAILSRRDAARWHALAGRVAETLEPRLDRRVLANRVTSRGPSLALVPVGPSLSRARRAARALAGTTPLLLHTDVEAFYPSVAAGVLARSLLEAGSDRDDARAAAGMLEGWGSEGYPGLPIGPPASAVMGNAVLRRVDEVLPPFGFLRWVDDYLVALPHERAAHELLERLDESLHGRGLSRASTKTALIPRGELRWLGASLVRL